MATKTMLSQIKFKSGTEAELSEYLEVGEFGLATDTGKLYVGGSLGDQIVTLRAYVDALEDRMLEKFEIVNHNFEIINNEKPDKTEILIIGDELDGGIFKEG